MLKKVLTFIGILVLLLLITIGIPSVMYHKYLTSVYYTMSENDKGDTIPTNMALLEKILGEVQNKDNVSNLSKEYENIFYGKNNDVFNMVIAFGIAIILILVLVTIIFNILDEKFVSRIFLVATIINILAYSILYYIIGVLKVVV